MKLRMTSLKLTTLLSDLSDEDAHVVAQYLVNAVVRQITAMIDSIERNSSPAGEPLITDRVHKLLRIAALVHDCGHITMSHVGERHLDTLPGICALRKWYEVAYCPRKLPSASEAIAATVVRSASFRELLALPQVGVDFVRNVDHAAHIIAGLLLGAPVIPGRAFLSLTLNGAFDADKLDYMPRDCLMAGVPSAVDTARIIQKIHCVAGIGHTPAGKQLTPSAGEALDAHVTASATIMQLAYSSLRGTVVDFYPIMRLKAETRIATIEKIANYDYS